MELPAFFQPDGNRLVPHPDARSPWSDEMLHGRLLAALAARAVERRWPATDGFVPARLTVDLFRAAPLLPVLVELLPVRDGRRVKTAEVRVSSDGREVARAGVLLLKAGEEPSGTVWAPPGWDPPDPETVPAPPREAPDRLPLDLRPVGGGWFGQPGPRRLWIREVRALVAGEVYSPLARVAGAADLANPFANSGDNGLQFINADLSLHLARLPAGEWIGLDVSFRVSRSGVAAAGCDLYDREGPLGACSVASVANPRLRGA